MQNQNKQIENLLIKIKELEERNRELRNILSNRDNEIRELKKIPKIIKPKEIIELGPEEIICYKCGNIAKLPFIPRYKSNDLLCPNCFRKSKRINASKTS